MARKVNVAEVRVKIAINILGHSQLQPVTIKKSPEVFDNRLF